MSQDKPLPSASATRTALPDSSMQDIIASISRIIAEDSRIIAEDSRTPIPMRGTASDNSGVLELTDAIADDGSVRKLNDGKPLDHQAAPDPLAPTTGAPSNAAPSDAAPVAPEPVIAQKAGEVRDDLVSPATSAAAVTAFGRLGRVASAQRAAPGPALGASARTLEEIVRDVLRPLLQAWLDDHLPALVERLVSEEIERLVRSAQQR